MKPILLAALWFVAESSALVARPNALMPRTSCCFGLSCSIGGSLGQLGDGQNRVYGGLPPSTYCIDNGVITDANGRGCILTPPPTAQFQCDAGVVGTPGFTVGCDSKLTYNGNPSFYECPTGDNGEYNVYTTPPSGQQGCVQAELTASGCSTCYPPYQGPTSCPAALTGDYQFPHLTIPVTCSSPDTACGTSYFGEVTPSISSLFMFDIPGSYSGRTCSLVFLFPLQSQLVTSSFTISGTAAIDFARLSGNANLGTTFNNKPSILNDYGVTTVSPGNSYTISSFDCPANSQVTFELSTNTDMFLNYFQDYNPSPIGLYITSC